MHHWDVVFDSAQPPYTSHHTTTTPCWSDLGLRFALCYMIISSLPRSHALDFLPFFFFLPLTTSLSVSASHFFLSLFFLLFSPSLLTDFAVTHPKRAPESSLGFAFFPSPFLFFQRHISSHHIKSPRWVLQTISKS